MNSGHSIPQMSPLRPVRDENSRSTQGSSPQTPGKWSGFTLLELLVSMILILFVLVATLSLMNLVSRSFQQTTGKLDSFETARTAFDIIIQRVKLATLQSYMGYDDPANPTSYQLKSDLHFICGTKTQLGLTNAGAPKSHALFFQTPSGLVDAASLRNANLLLNTTGFFIAYGNDPLRPAILDGKVEDRRRYRLFQFLQPREKLTVYQSTLTELDGIRASNPSFHGSDWFSADILGGKYIHPIAENVIAVAILPISPGRQAKTYSWNSRDKTDQDTLNRLPRMLKIMLAIIDEDSAMKFGNPETPPVIVPESLFTDPDQFSDDIKTLDGILGAFTPKLNFRIFTAEVELNASTSNL